MVKIPKSHPRYFSLMTREKVSQAMKKGFLVHETGLIAHGRGEAFDYLIGEKTIPIAEDAEKVTAAALLCAKSPVISVNGNVVALAAKECIGLAEAIPAKLEVNLFHRTEERMEKLVNELKKQGAKKVTEVHLVIGKLTFLGIEQVRFAYHILVEDTILKGSKLIIEEKDGVIKCHSCGYKGTLETKDNPIYHVPTITLRCPECGEAAKIVEGKECTIKSIKMVK